MIPFLKNITCSILLLITYCIVNSAIAQDIEPRRWTPIPLDLQIIGVGYVKSSGDITFDPVMLVDDAKYDLDVLGVSYVTSFKLFNKLARFDMTLPMAKGRWEGLLNGEQTKISREGLLDPTLRVSVNLIGTPATNAKEMSRYLGERQSNTVVGAAISLALPLGEYYNDKLINLGENRFTIRPQLGVVHTDGNWSYELTGSVFIHTDNTDFNLGKTREQKNFYTIQSHLIYSLNAGKWISVSAGYGLGGESTVDDIDKNDKKHMLLSGLSFGMPLSKYQAVKVAYVNGQTNSDTGSNTNSLFFSFSQLF